MTAPEKKTEPVTDRWLAELGTGASGKVTGLAGGHGIQSRLIGLGIRPGVTLEVRRNDGRGPVVVAMGRARVALGRGMASQIRVA